MHDTISVVLATNIGSASTIPKGCINNLANASYMASMA